MHLEHPHYGLNFLLCELVKQASNERHSSVVSTRVLAILLSGALVYCFLFHACALLLVSDSTAAAREKYGPALASLLNPL